MKYLGIDWGKKRIGLALADSETKIATPFKTVGNLGEVVSVAESEEVDLIVIGKPYPLVNISGYARSGEARQYPISDEFEKFITELKSKINAPIELVDERLSSKAADALPGDKKTKASRDEIAAMLILQSWLDKK
ncbi:MAG: Holliday junction resolvase RuvX [bacterium]|nr:Holliday junction resolvase RuvX [bacterium]